MLGSGASHNLMPKAIMEILGLDITRNYHDLYSFDSRRVKCLGLIKDLVVSLEKIPTKNVIIDIVVADITPEYGIFLSRSWGENLRGTLHLVLRCVLDFVLMSACDCFLFPHIDDQL